MLKCFESAEQSFTDFLNGRIALFACGIGVNGVGFHMRIYLSGQFPENIFPHFHKKPICGDKYM